MQSGQSAPEDQGPEFLVCEELDGAFGGTKNLERTLDYIAERNGKADKDAVRAMLLAAEADPDVFRERFVESYVREWPRRGKDRRPGLPLIASIALGRMGIDSGRAGESGDLPKAEVAIVRALMITAIRAEMVRGKPPSGKHGRINEYHNTPHTAHVATAMAALCLRSGLERRDRLIGMLAALAHDIDHPGGSNPPGDIYCYEKKSLAVIEPIMAVCGMEEADKERVRVAILCTSPQGPSMFLKDVIAARKSGGARIMPDPSGPFEPVAAVTQDETLAEIAAMLVDADVFTSTTLGLEGSLFACRKLTAEFNRCNPPGAQCDLTTDESRLYFLKNMFVDYASAVAREAFGPHCAALRTLTEERVGAARRSTAESIQPPPSTRSPA